jgi:hypothetical protein
LWGRFFLSIADMTSFTYAWRMTRIFYCLMLCSFSLQADVYRLVDESGNVSYSDQSHPNATLIEIEALPTYTPIISKGTPNINRSTTDGATAVPVYKIAILSPANDQAFWESSGTVEVKIQVEPELNQNRGDLIKVVLDGKQAGDLQSNTLISLTNIDRGSHSLKVTVVSSKGELLASSEQISFQLHRRSIINQPKKAN